jgi:cobalt-zinc-cadmium efflux system membrane fusion protein
MRNRSIVIIALLAVLAAAAVTVYLHRKQMPEATRTEQEAADAVQKAQPVREATSAIGIVRLSSDQQKQYGIETATAGPGRLHIEVTLPGEVALNTDRVAHVVPRISGVVREVRKNLGDTVRTGEIMAVLESRELADSIAAMLAARERVQLAQSNFAREERLWKKRISAEQDYIQAKNNVAEANIELRVAEQKLRALGFSDAYIAQLPGSQDRLTPLYEITAPFDGIVTEKHISLGEVLKDDAPAFVIADLSSVWVNLDVHQKDLPLIQVGQKAVISVGGNITERAGRVSFLDPVATETNRTIHARVVLENSDGRFRPGLFVSGRIEVEDFRVPVLAPDEALVMIDGKMCVFVREGEAFKLQEVGIGRTDGTSSEIKRGLLAGQTYVIKGAFTLKSELGKPAVEQ